MFGTINTILTKIDDLVWGVPLIVMILATGIFLTIRLKGIQVRKLILAFKYMFSNETDGEHGEISSFGALCTALSATIGTGNIVGVATAIVAGGPGALFWMIVAPLLVQLQSTRMSSRHQIQNGCRRWTYCRRTILLHRKRYG